MRAAHRRRPQQALVFTCAPKWPGSKAQRRLERNRTAVGRALHIKTDWIGRGSLGFVMASA